MYMRFILACQLTPNFKIILSITNRVERIFIFIDFLQG